MSQTEKASKADNIALYIIYATAAYFGVQFLLKERPSKRAAAILPLEPEEAAPKPIEPIFSNATNTSKSNKTSTVKTTLWLAEQFPMRKGMKGSMIATMQSKFRINPDGKFGTDTEKELIKRYGVSTVTETLYKRITSPLVSDMDSALYQLNQLKPSAPKEIILKQGSKGQEVYQLQKWLGFKDKAQAKKGEALADGIMGKVTVQALIKRTGKNQISSSQFKKLTGQ